MFLKIFNKIIEYSFYGLFLLVPLAFTSATSELFELNKMWLTWGLTIIIGMSWLTKMILQRRILFQQTPLDIPIALFLISQIISTIFSLDFHVSLWGYYSRFNGGLLSIISYVFLYYAFVSNLLSKTIVHRLLAISLISGLIVALWGLPSHFGYDPTCLLFRGTLDVSCWTADFMPRVRIFSTLGQPDWLAAYLAILIPITIALILTISQNHRRPSTHLRYFVTLILLILFYIDLLYTRARSGFLGIWISLIFFFVAYFFMERKKTKFSILNSQFSIILGIFLIATFVIGTPINQLNKFTLHGIGSYFQKPAITETQKRTEAQNDAKFPESGGPARRSLGEGGTESADIRLFVWEGAINAWKNNPIFGTGVETFAFAYYKYKPAGQNLTSEWNFLYNKAHNEYLNYLATTGLFGLGSYLFMIGTFLFMTIKKLFLENSEHSENQKFRQSDNLNVRKSGIPSFPSILSIALLASYISILITNFFGFSVVITNIYLFMIPAFVFILGGMLKPEKQFVLPRSESKVKNYESSSAKISLYQWTFIFFIILASVFMILNLIRFWQADIAYALGYNLDRAGEYQKAYGSLHKAVELRGDELVFKDELSINSAIIAAGLASQKDQNQSAQDQKMSIASSLIQEAINTSNEIISKSPHNAVFWKTRTRVFYTLSQIDSRYLPRAVEAIEKASVLAPNDANISYNLGVLYGQNNNITKGIQALEKTVKLKPDYRDAHYALGLYYHTAALDEKRKVVMNQALNQKAIAQMRYILDHLNPQDPGALDSIKDWGKP